MNSYCICEDFFNISAELGGCSFDLIVLDIPYNIGISSWDNMVESEYFNFIDLLVIECKRLLRDSGSIWLFSGWSNVVGVKSIFDKFFTLKNWIIWDRIKGRGAKYNFISTREDILWYVSSDNYTFNKQSSTIKKKTGGMGKKNGDDYRKLSNVWTDISPLVPWSKEKVKHPTQKPIKLLERIISVSTNVGDIVLDPFAGSGSTGFACKNLNRKYVLVEKDSKYFNLFNDRL